MNKKKSNHQCKLYGYDKKIYATVENGNEAAPS